MSILDLCIKAFVIFTPIYCFLLLYILIKIDKEFPAQETTISKLAESVFPYNIVFNVTTSIYGILALAPIIKFLIINPISIYIALLILLYSFVCIGTFFVGVFPINTKTWMHYKVARFLFISLLLMEIMFIGSYIKDKGMLPVSLMSFLLFILTSILIIRARDITKDRDYVVWEWIVFIGALIWNIIFSISLL